jgi:uncharacterized repeat protein (TIGR03803 family)
MRRSRAYALVLLCATTASMAQTFTTLHSFDSTDGANPNGGLALATNGSFYGTTQVGGSNGDGTVFKITPAGALTTLYSFCSSYECEDGANPYAGLALATNGNLYGTTRYGGLSSCDGDLPPISCGTVFEITPTGTLTTFNPFYLGGLTGSNPTAALIQGADGELYGTTFGEELAGGTGNGAVFKITSGGTSTPLYSFCQQQGPCQDGADPYAGLVQCLDGNFYGTTLSGGAGNGYYGTVFKITPGGTLTLLYNFCSLSGCTDGESPYAGLVQASDGNFYGTTNLGGNSNLCNPYPGCGTVFRITPSGELTTLHSFCAQTGCTDGAFPSGGLIQATDGNLYGTTGGGGAFSGPNCTGCGTIFKITKSGTLTTLYSFCSRSGCLDGWGPNAPLLQATDGKFYGTTYSGGAYENCSSDQVACGTVFSLSTGLRPFVETQTNFGKVGGAVKILGTNLKGVTSVEFNGTPTTFKVVSASLITTTVPVGAATGFVTVATTGGTLTSNKQFRVIP